MSEETNTVFEEQMKEIQEKAKKIFLEGSTLMDVQGISREEMEAVYTLAYSFYQTGRYEDAEKIFRFLVNFDNLSQKYWIGYGAVQQVQKNYEGAVRAYSFAGFLDLDNPKPQYYAAECYAAMGDTENALSAIASLEEFVTDNSPVSQEFRKKAAELKAKIENDL